VGPLHFPGHCSDGQGFLRQSGGQPFGCRRCLLKDCERWFRAAHPQARYCSPACQQAARRWRSWRAARRYRASTNGKQRRQGQSRRYRQRQQQPSPAVSGPPPPEGQRAGEIPENSSGCPCDRPGCYQLFVLSPRSVQQHFCSSACRQALRRVRQREVRRQERRRRGVRPRRGQPSRLTDDTS
jgi:hypothetical protein